MGELSWTQCKGSQAIPAPEARTPFVEIRLALQLISPPKEPAPPEVWQCPATLPFDGLEPIFGRLPKGVSQQWLLDMAWDWRNSCVTPEVQIPVRVPSESHLLEMEMENLLDLRLVQKLDYLSLVSLLLVFLLD